MYTVLLIDDESTTLDTLTTSIQWQQFGVDKLFTASDGFQALDIMKHQQVDLLITDIKMPHMDGLTLLNEVRKLYPETHCILLTAYEEFEYARKAIQLGVENYLLKPLEMEEMTETIEKAFDNIYTSRKINQNLFRDNILLRWVNGNISSEELSERANMIDVNIYCLEYCVVCICKKQNTLSLANYCKTCVEKLSSSYEVHYFKDDFNRYVFIIGGHKINIQQIINYFRKGADQIDISHHIALAVGNTVQDIDKLSKSYQSACSLMNGADMSSSEIIILLPHNNNEQKEIQLTQTLNTLFHQQDELRYDSFQHLANKLFQMSQESSTEQILTLLVHSLSRLFAQEFPSLSIAQDQLHRRIHLLVVSQNREALTSSIVELLEYSCLLFNYYFNQLSPIIQSAISYIHKHYSEGISIKEFCIKNKMSTPYLGYLFKKETGIFFNNYLLQYRISYSIHLLLDTDQKINDIAQNVGFASTSYYISCFKKQTGLSPIKFRTQQSQENTL